MAASTHVCRFSLRRRFPLASPLSFILLVLIFLSTYPRATDAARNITVSSFDPPLYDRFEGAQWKRIVSGEERLTIGQSWMSAYVAPGSPMSDYLYSYYMDFEFPGTALYLYYPLWDVRVTSGNISVDGSEPVIISLRDPGEPDPHVTPWEGYPPSKQSEIRYSIQGLKYGNHTLRITADRNAAFIAFDTLMYTDDEAPSDGVPDWHTSFPGEATTPTTTPTSTPSSTAPPGQNRNTPTIAASVAAAVVGLVAIAVAVFCFKRCRRRKERYRYPLPGVTSDPETSQENIQATFPESFRNHASFQGLTVASPYPSPIPSPPLFTTTTHHRQPSSEALLPSESGRIVGGRGTLRVANDTSPTTDAHDGSAPPAYETLAQALPQITRSKSS
ncbi:hypothetical protein NMY22_g5888 [Coprinellus aureogranulatus]|nr:hypothetical protein NMY22_g5888 [Coprinellus aureogranulatus]